MTRICVFCGSNPGNDPVYMDTAREVGRLLASNNIGVVYGGGSTGLMGAVAESALINGVEVIGVIPTKLKAREVAKFDVSELYEVATMHERKALMDRLS